MNNKDKIEFLSQPLMTEDGFVNQACVNELESAIKNTEPASIRLAGDAEWSTKRVTSLSDITGSLAKCAIRQHPYNLPKGLETVIGYLTACLKREVVWDELGFAMLSLCDINKLLHDILMEQGITDFDNWNKTHAELNGGSSCPDISFVSAYAERKAEHDFIDLHALLHNVCLDIRMERRACDLFDNSAGEPK